MLPLQKSSSHGEQHILRNVIVSRVFRANPELELVLFDRLPPSEQEALASLKGQLDLYGILRPREPAGLNYGAGKAVNRETALLYLTLQNPGRLPSYVVQNPETDLRELVSLVLDGVLEVEHEKNFVSGPAASPLLLDGLTTPGKTKSSSATQKLSEQALQYGAAIEIDEPPLLAARLYAFNRVPLSPEWVLLLPDSQTVRTFLFDGAKDLTKWNLSADEANGEWFVFSRAGRRGRGVRPLTWYKLYISPWHHYLRDALEGVMKVLAHHRVEQFKISRSPAGLLRPDKIVAYFDAREDLAGAADELGKKLAGIPAQGVPFTAGISRDGMLSWGIDPPAEAVSGLAARESWRQWITMRLASALVAARRSPSQVLQPERYALERVRLEGIDVNNWIPTGGAWKPPSEANEA